MVSRVCSLFSALFPLSLSLHVQEVRQAMFGGKTGEEPSFAANSVPERRRDTGKLPDCNFLFLRKS